MTKTVPLSMRFEPDFKAKLQKLADSENRSLTNYIDTVLREHVKMVEVDGKERTGGKRK